MRQLAVGFQGRVSQRQVSMAACPAPVASPSGLRPPTVVLTRPTVPLPTAPVQSAARQGRVRPFDLALLLYWLSRSGIPCCCLPYDYRLDSYSGVL